MSNRPLTAPVAEPLTLAEAKDWVEETTNAKDAFIARLISAARESCQALTHRAISMHEREETLDKFPAGGLIRLQYPPIVSITSVIYADANGEEQTLSPSSYKLDNASASANGWLSIATGYSWPVTANQINAIRIQYLCGYEPGAVPELLKTWMLTFIADLYSNRESVNVGNITSTFDYVDKMLDDFRVY